MSIKYFLNTSYSPQCLDRFKEELASAKWYKSPYDTERSDLSTELTEHLQSILPFKISDAGFLRRRPISIYHPHVDPKRMFALNLLMTNDSDSEDTFVMETDLNMSYTKTTKVDYTQGCFTILNVKKVHYVVNHSDNDRIVLSIGCNEIPYEKIIYSLMSHLVKL
jgi:hypothetical protein